MRYLVWVELDGFYATEYPEPGPMVVARQRRVLDADPVARRRGIRLGMGVRQARALVEGLVVRPWQADRYHARRNAWLDICTEFTGIIEPEDQHAASLDLTGHPDPLDVAERLVRALSRSTGLLVRYGIAPSKWIARLAAGQDDLPEGGEGWAITKPAEFLAPLPVLDLLPIAPEHRDRLHFLGYRRIGDLAQVPLATLQGQFGDEGLRIRQAALGALFEPVQARYPEGSFVDSFIFESPVDSTEALDAALRVMAKRLGERLSDNARQSSKVSVTLEDENGKRYSRERRFTKPICSSLTTLAALRLMVEAEVAQVKKGEVASIHVKLTDLEIVRRRQSELNGFIPHGERRPEADSALHYIRTVYGDRAVRRASEIEVPRRVQVLREWKNATGWC